MLTAFENVELPLLLTKLDAQQRRDHVLTALKLVGLEERMTIFPNNSQADRNSAWPSLAPSSAIRRYSGRRAYRRSRQPFRH